MEQIHTLPHSADAESDLLCALLADSSNIGIYLDTLPKKSDFFVERNALVFEAIITLVDQNIIINSVTLEETLRNAKTFERVGGFPHISNLLQAGIAVENIEYYSNLIIEKSQRRLLIKQSENARDKAYADGEAIKTVLENAEKNIIAIANKTEKDTPTHVRHGISEVIAYMNEPKPEGVPTGYPHLDSKIIGLQKSETLIIGARTHIGKTSFMLNLVNNITVGDKIPTAIFSIEMKQRKLLTHLVALRAGIPLRKIMHKTLSDQEKERFTNACETLKESPLYLTDNRYMGLFDIRVQSRRLVRKEGVKAIFIDHMGIITPPEEKLKLPRYEQVATISRQLRALAGELQTPIVLLSQLNRKAEEDGKEPVLSSLAESTALEQDADTIILIHREDRASETAKIKVVKNRQGETGNIMLDFNTEHLRFTSSEIAY